jgi:hypothetical protein
MTRYGFVADPRSEVAVPACGILSRTIHEDERLSTGQELSEHTSARAAVIEVLT